MSWQDTAEKIKTIIEGCIGTGMVLTWEPMIDNETEFRKYTFKESATKKDSVNLWFIDRIPRYATRGGQATGIPLGMYQEGDSYIVRGYVDYENTQESYNDFQDMIDALRIAFTNNISYNGIDNILYAGTFENGDRRYAQLHNRLCHYVEFTINVVRMGSANLV